MRLHLCIALALLFVLIVQSVPFAQEGTLEWGEITSAALEGNLLGDPATRPFAVYLPPGYAGAEKRYPAVYALHGFDSGVEVMVALVAPPADRMIQDGEIGEMIVVFVDGSNRLGGSRYLSSVTLGDYETYITRDLVNHVDAHYRTIPDRTSRGVTGYSMGGYGAIHLALRFPDVFGAVVAQAGMYDLPAYLAVRDLGGRSMRSWYAGTLPNPDNPPDYFDVPYELVNGAVEVIPDLLQKLVEHDALHDLDRYLGQSVRLNGIKIVHGTGDLTVTVEQARTFDTKLTDKGIDHVYVEHSGGHDFISEEALVFLSDWLYFTPLRESIVSAAITPCAGMAGQAMSFQLAVVLDEPTPVPVRAMLADLSGLGISYEVPLQQSDGGRYAASQTITPPRRGQHPLPVVVQTRHEWDTDDTWYPFFTLVLDVYPAGDLIIYDDAPGEGWSVTTLRDQPDLMCSAFVHSGSFSHAILLSEQTMATYTFTDPEGLHLFGYTHLEFWINGGEASGQDPTIAGKKLSQRGVVPEADTWKQVIIPISELTDPLTSFYFGGWSQDTFYIDDMKLVAEEMPTAVEEVAEPTAAPSRYALAQNVPNPFNPVTNIAYDLPEAQDARLDVYNIRGQHVATLVSARHQPGRHEVSWDARGLGTGLYFYHLRAGSFVQTRRMVLLK